MSFKFDQIEIHTQKKWEGGGRVYWWKNQKTTGEKTKFWIFGSFVLFFWVRSRSNVSSHEKYLRLFYLHLFNFFSVVVISLIWENPFGLGDGVGTTRVYHHELYIRPTDHRDLLHADLNANWCDGRLGRYTGMLRVSTCTHAQRWRLSNSKDPPPFLYPTMGGGGGGDVYINVKG